MKYFILPAAGVSHLDIGAWPYSLAGLENARYIHELPKSNTITVNLDYRQMGVGGDNS